jgi:hypothetical protein
MNNKKILDVDTPTAKINSNSNVKKPIIKKPNAIRDSDYKRPQLTYTDKLSKKEIESLLLDYEKVDDLSEVPTGTHIRYFEDKDGELKFRLGGTLTIKTGLPVYCILTNNKVSWSVQVKKCIFFKRISIKDIKEEYEEKLLEKDKDINELRSLVRKLKTEIIDIKKNIKRGIKT